MNNIRDLSTLLVMVVAGLCLIVGTVGCGDDVAGGDSGPESADDCADDEIYHPVSGCLDEEEETSDDDSGGGSGGGAPDEDFGCGTGHIEGQACRPDGQLLPQAEVIIEGVDCDGDSFVEETTTDGDGNYSVYDVPAGSHDMTIRSGSFETTEPVAVYEGETTNLHSEAAKVCVESDSVDIAVIEGSMDDIGSILESIEVDDYDVVGSDGTNTSASSTDATHFLEQPSQLFDYDILFIECGFTWSSLSSGADHQTIRENLREFVDMGNSLYVSDWAYEMIQEALPEAVEFYNEDSTGNARQGPDGFQSAEVVSQEMSTLLGSSSTVQLDLEVNWAVAVAAGANTEVHFQSDVNMGFDETIYNAPLMTAYHGGDGQAIFTSFHNEDQSDSTIEEIMEFVVFQL